LPVCRSPERYCNLCSTTRLGLGQGPVRTRSPGRKVFFGEGGRQAQASQVSPRLGPCSGRCASPRYPRDYTSHRLFTDDLTKHRRLEYDPMTTFRRAVTNTQEFGWHTAARTAQPSRYFPLSSTDVSRNEGSQPSNYFGTCH